MQGTVEKFEPVIKNSMGRETIYNADYFEV